MYQFALALLFGCSLAALGNAEDFLMTVGGWKGNVNTDIVDTVELKSLSPDAPLPECLRSPRGNFPKRLYGAVGISLGDRVVVCGGSDPDRNYLSTCWSYDAVEDRWDEDGSMGERRWSSAAALTSRKEWVISGGYDMSYKSNVESTPDGRNFETFPSMPITLYYHCIISLDGDEGDLFVTGGLSWR